MSTTLFRLASAVVELPEDQRAVLVPLFAKAIFDEAPEGTLMPVELASIVEAFFAELGPDSSQWSERIEERLRAANVTNGLLAELGLRAGIQEPARGWTQLSGEKGPGFAPRTAPTEGQTRSGPAARFQLRAPASRNRETSSSRG